MGPREKVRSTTDQPALRVVPTPKKGESFMTTIRQKRIGCIAILGNNERAQCGHQRTARRVRARSSTPLRGLRKARRCALQLSHPVGEVARHAQ